jgi:prolyl-tRNA synthetase
MKWRELMKTSSAFQARVVRRDNGAKADIPTADLVEKVNGLLDEVQKNLFETAKQKRDACLKVVNTWDEFIVALNDKKLILAPWCDEEVRETFL